MRKIVEYTLVSADGVFGSPAGLGFMQYRDDAYLRDGLGLLCTSDAMLMGRNFYDGSAELWQSRVEHPWAARLNEMKKYVFSSTLTEAAWTNSVILDGDVVEETRRLKADGDGDLVIWGHTRLAETLMRSGSTCLICRFIPNSLGRVNRSFGRASASSYDFSQPKASPIS